MFPFKQTLTTKNITPWTNTKEYIIVHHTGTPQGTIAGNIKALTTGAVSCHFIVDGDGSAYKIWSPDNILWHAGVSGWGARTNMNSYSLGIETIGPDFTDKQRATVRALIQHLMATFNIPNANVLRHADITWGWSSSKTLWDGVSPSRKVDIAESFWKINRTSWKQYQDSLVPKSV